MKIEGPIFPQDLELNRVSAKNVGKNGTERSSSSSLKSESDSELQLNGDPFIAQIKAISDADPDRSNKIFSIYLRWFLTKTFGANFLSDPKLAELAREAQNTMMSDQELSSKISGLSEDFKKKILLAGQGRQP